MKTLYHFFRLIRLLNLLVIVLTMTVVQMFLTHNQPFDKTNFILLVISTVLIAAAGNIINDYFDVKADRVNKPNRLIIGKYIKRRWAMVLHWFFNVIGLFIALYVGYVLQNIWIPLIAFLSINLLWFYSAYYKRKPLIGNVIVSLLIGVLPIYVLLFNLPIENYIYSDGSHIIYARYYIDMVALVSVLAFLLNLIREIVKDIQDVRGDMRLGAQTLPIKYGIKKTKLIVVFLFIVTDLAMIFYLYKYLTWDGVFMNAISTIDNYTNFAVIENNTRFLFFGLLLMSFLFLLVGVITTLISNTVRVYKLSSILFKISMIMGLLTPLVL